MSETASQLVLVAGPHHGLSEGIRNLLSAVFGTIVMVADEASLFESALRLKSDLVIVDMSLARNNGLNMVRNLHRRFPGMKMVVLSSHNWASLGHAVLDAGAGGFVLKGSIATDLLDAADAVLSGHNYISPGLVDRNMPNL